MTPLPSATESPNMIDQDPESGAGKGSGNDSGKDSGQNSKRSLILIFLIVLVDLIGFGIMIPVLPTYARNLGGGAEIGTLTISLYAIGMLISTPILGRISDEYGRRPVLMLSMAGAIGGYILLAFSTSIWMVALSRLISGIMAGNIAAAQAYITDITTPENRARGMGMLGAAFGLGFIVGPLIGATLGGDSFNTISMTNIALTSAVLSGLSFLSILFLLPESLTSEQKQAARQEDRISRLEAVRILSRRPIILTLVFGGLLYGISAGLIETILPIWAEAVDVAAGPKDLRLLLVAAGMSLVIVQGGLIGPLTRRFGEATLLRAGSFIFFIAMFLLVYAGTSSNFYGVVAAMCVQSASAALILTSSQSLVSMRADASQRGLVMGLFGSASMLGRATGAALTGLAFSQISVHAPYYGGALLMVALFLLISRVIKQLNSMHPGQDLSEQNAEANSSPNQ
ncbi:tetracycline resistance MFS efflux pump [Kordiimonas sediminis]|uniref:Tetracycline resistance MFS efflux pump n=1 Tax=Kordiimonas sediminis TaxID=1735581 RepID=A0A919AMV7_9PROT|nr:MFS transporter [Kordiimonas sediminis]GHF16823.1 tetracycline resistance MFS efflux pump [Kordiimonas sediminis]